MCLNVTQVCCNNKDISTVFSGELSLEVPAPLNRQQHYLFSFGNELTSGIEAAFKKAVSLVVMAFYFAPFQSVEVLLSLFLFCLQTPSEFEVLQSSASQNAICGLCPSLTCPWPVPNRCGH